MRIKEFLFVSLAAVILFSGCVGTNAMGVFDISIPEEKLSHLQIRNNLSVVLFNSQPVEWAPGLTQNKVTISLPPGEHSFMVRYFVSDNRGHHTVTANIPATTFLPGHTYRIYKRNIWLVFFTITNVRIRDVTPRNQRTTADADLL